MLKQIINNLRLLSSNRPENAFLENKIIRDSSSLSKLDIDFVQSWSISGLGLGIIFYLLFRNLYESLAVLGIAGFIGNHIEKNWFPLLLTETGLWSSVLIQTLVVLVVAFWVYGIYFLVRHGRRLSWNRCEWKSIEEFKQSEKIWFRLNFIGSAVVIIIFYLI